MDPMQSARERSIGNLQRLYTVVVSLAIAESRRRLVLVVEQGLLQLSLEHAASLLQDISDSQQAACSTNVYSGSVMT